MSFETFESTRFTAKSLALIEQVSIGRRRRWLSDAFPAAFGGDMKLLALGVGRLVWPAAKAVGISAPSAQRFAEMAHGLLCLFRRAHRQWSAATRPRRPRDRIGERRAP